jgi:hypothetical protein
VVARIKGLEVRVLSYGLGCSCRVKSSDLSVQRSGFRVKKKN